MITGKSTIPDTKKINFQKGKKLRTPAIPVDYKNKYSLLPFVTERYKIIPRRISGLSCRDQRHLQIAIKRARHLALIPYTTAQLPSPVKLMPTGKMTTR